MGLFGSKKTDEHKLSFALGTITFTADDQYLTYKSSAFQSFRVALKDIESVSLDQTTGMGKNILKVNSKGITLAQVELPRPWAEKVQEFITKLTSSLP